MQHSLQLAALYGVFVVATAQPSTEFGAEALREVAEAYSCHTNFGGFVLSADAGSRSVLRVGAGQGVAAAVVVGVRVVVGDCECGWWWWDRE